MFSFVGYNFVGDVNGLDPAPTSLQQITSTTIQNGIFDNYTVTRDISFEYTTDIPSVWEYLTIMDANLNGNIRAGNIDFLVNQISKVKVKRRIKGSFDWITLYEIPVTGVESLNFVEQDNLNQWGIEYEYAFVPMINNEELNYITNSIVSKFNGVFICDVDTIFKFYSNVNYSGINKSNRTTVFEPLGGRYPVVVSNSATRYDSGSVSGNIILEEELNNYKLDRLANVQYRNKLFDFLVNKKAKVLKDWNGNIWLMVVVNSPSANFLPNSGMALAQANFDFVEVGDINNADDLYENGLVGISPVEG